MFVPAPNTDIADLNYRRGLSDRSVKVWRFRSTAGNIYSVPAMLYRDAVRYMETVYYVDSDHLHCLNF